MSWEHAAEARAALNAIVADPQHGVAALSSAQTMSNLLKDLLPDAPREKSILVAAAEAGLADNLRQHIDQGMDANTAIRLTASSFSSTTPFTPEACTWVTSEIATALGISRGSGGGSGGTPSGYDPGLQGMPTQAAPIPGGGAGYPPAQRQAQGFGQSPAQGGYAAGTGGQVTTPGPWQTGGQQGAGQQGVGQQGVGQQGIGQQGGGQFGAGQFGAGQPGGQQVAGQPAGGWQGGAQPGSGWQGGAPGGAQPGAGWQPGGYAGQPGQQGGYAMPGAAPGGYGVPGAQPGAGGGWPGTPYGGQAGQPAGYGAQPGGYAPAAPTGPMGPIAPGGPGGPVKRGRRGLWIGGGAAALVLVVAVVLATSLSGGGNTNQTHHHTTPPTTPPPTSSPASSPTPTHPPGTDSLLSIMNPVGETPLGTDCEQGHLFGLDASTLVARRFCGHTTRANIIIWGYQFDSFGDYQKGLDHFNHFLGFNLHTPGSTCPPPSGSVEGKTTWHTFHNPKYNKTRNGQDIECVFNGKNPVLLWTMPTQDVFFVAKDKLKNTTIHTVIKWWETLVYGQ